MKKITLLTLLLLTSVIYSQTTVNFDDDAKWTAGSAALGGYASDHTYVDGLFSATGGEALRQGVAAQDGFPGAFGVYSWRLRNVTTVDWRITIASGGVSTFSMDIRRWDGSPSPDFNLEYSIDGGTNWTFVAAVNNTTLNNTSDWTNFSGTINSAVNNVIIRLVVNSAATSTERIMVDNFIWTQANLSVNDSSRDGFSMYPNPTNQGIVTIQSALNEPKDVIVYDVLGKQVLAKRLIGNTLNVSNLKSGVYLVQVTENNNTSTKKLIIK